MIDNQNLAINKNNNNSLENCSTNNNLMNATTNNNENKLNLIEKMSSSEVTDMLIQLLLICWASSAGNLQYAYMNTNILLNENNKSCSRTISNSSNGSKQQQQQQQQPNEDNTITKTTDDSIATPKQSKEVKFCLQDHRLSTGSNMSTSSMDSNENHNQQQQQYSPLISSGQLHSGICIKQTSISNKDIKIALKAIEMISCFLYHRKDAISSFLSLKIFSDCVIDVLTGSISNKIRVYMKKFLLKLGQLETSSGLENNESSFKCKDFLINLIIKSRLPLWVNSSISRTSTQRLILQSTQYFSLRSKLFNSMTAQEQKTYSIDLKKMLNDESNWFLIFSPTKNLKNVDNILLAGHFSLTKALLTCETANKIEFGAKIIPLLIRTYLFPAAHLISDPEADQDNSMDPICSDEYTRIAAYKLLVELSRDCLINYQLISKQLINFHHSQNPASMSSDWNYIPLVTPRAECGYAGLKNGGATCYMNAILQQLYMMPGVPEYLLSIDSDDHDKISVFYQLQNVFAHLKESKLEYYIPEHFWKAFRMWGQEVNIREQQDAYDFFISMTDQIDEYLKKMNKEPIFKNILEGTFSNQFICTDCPHRYEREEAFLGLNLPIKSGNLEESLLQFVKDELLDGENAYNCEKCNEKRSAIKRTCIKKLPKYLCIQLKRFDYDWESNRSLKFDDFFQFPRELDLAPYMYESINKTRQTTTITTNSFSNNLDKPNSTSLTDLDDNVHESKMETSNNPMSNSSANLLSQSLPSQTIQFKKKLSMTKSIEQNNILYELVGIVVHSGQANAGHYYSFIKGFNNNQ
jgi:ubiquitin carboxyl-terminal hydrolase 9/24